MSSTERKGMEARLCVVVLWKKEDGEAETCRNGGHNSGKKEGEKPGANARACLWSCLWVFCFGVRIYMPALQVVSCVGGYRTPAISKSV